MKLIQTILHQKTMTNVMHVMQMMQQEANI
jgi:hypothetical protein